MLSLKRACLVISISLLMVCCVPETGDSNLAGTWSCHETSQIFLKSTKGTSVFEVKFVSDSTSSDKYYIDNIYNLGSGIRVSVVRDGYSITMQRQTADKIVFEGSGTINETYDLINLTYTADDGGGVVDHVTSEYSR